MYKVYVCGTLTDEMRHTSYGSLLLYFFNSIEHMLPIKVKGRAENIFPNLSYTV